jgi:hypothetical protein
MNFLFIYSLFNFILINANEFSSIEFYNDKICSDIDFIVYSYINLEICTNNIILEKCNYINKFNESSKGSCGTDSLKDTKKKIKTDFIYSSIYNLNCTDQIGSMSISLDKCIKYMGTYYFKIIKQNNDFISNYYSDDKCSIKIIENNIDNKFINLELCKDKNKIYTKNGILQNKTKNDNIENVTNKNSISLLIVVLTLIMILIN